MGILSTLLSISILGINAKALDKITVGGAVDPYTNFSTAWMINCTGHNAYSEVFLRQGNGDNATNTISSNSGIMNCADQLKATGYRTMAHAFSTGIVYYGNYPYSGVEASDTKRVGE